MAVKSVYRGRNWRQYNRSLIDRGDITIWLSDDAIAKWRAESRDVSGRPHVYSDHWIETLPQLRLLFSLPLRATHGFMMGMRSMLDIEVGVPDYTTLSRRAAKLQPTLENLNWTRPTHVVIDATGLKVYGEGEWQCRTHGKSKRRTWRKFHVAINRETLEFISVDLTESNVHDSKRTTKLLEPLFPIATVTAGKRL
jgi:hypothetical protein